MNRLEMDTPPPLLRVDNLQVELGAPARPVRPVDGVSFTLPAGQTLALVGESGCGKSMTALACMRLLPAGGRIAAGSVHLGSAALHALPETRMRDIRGNHLAMIFQEPATSLNPVFTIGFQVGEAIRLHRPEVPRQKVREEVLKALKSVHVSDPERRLDQYPHEMSGGMKQRIMIAMALACKPQLLIADEPTTAVDVTIQARILDLLRDIQAEHHMAILLITHDLGVVAELADDVVVMYAGQVIEQAPVNELFDNPRHPYTLGLFASLPRVDQTKSRLETIEGSVPPATHFPEGCRFRERCKWAGPECTKEPPLLQIGGGHTVACWYHDTIASQRSVSSGAK